MKLQLDESLLVHKSNLRQKQVRAGRPREKELVEIALIDYEKYITGLNQTEIAAGKFASAVASLESYIQAAKRLEKAHKLFNWRSDYAGSIIPEFLYRMIASVAHARGIAPLFTTRESIVEITYSGAVDGACNLRHKNQDLTVGLRTDTIIVRGEAVTFVVPIVVLEVKTNIDINKLNGLDFSAARLKRSFPAARYLLVTETIDFSLTDDYASGSLDQVYVLRKVLRARNRRAVERLQSDVFEALVSDVVNLLKRESDPRGHVYERLRDGRLIGHAV